MEGYMKNEQVRDVVGYEGLYGVSNKGNVYSLRSGCLIEGQKGAYVTLSKDGKGKSWRIGDLVAMAWIRNVGGLRFVRHKDGDIRHNVVSNLEWCTARENNLHAHDVLKKNTRPILCIETGVVYPSIRNAARAIGYDNSTLQRICAGKGRSKTAKGFHWRYVCKS